MVKDVACYIEFDPCELKEVLRETTRVWRWQSKSPHKAHPIPYCTKVTVWRGRGNFRIARDCSFGGGISITQLNGNSARHHVKNLAPSEKLSPPGHLINNKGIYLKDEADVRGLVNIVQDACKAMCLRRDIASQSYDTHHQVTNQMLRMHSASPEIYYWLVLETFFSLDIPVHRRLPACVVLSDFLKGFLDETYSLYHRGKSCECCTGG